MSEYEIMLQSDSGHSVTERVQSSSGCIENTCAHNFISWSANGSSYHVSIAARNAVTLGQRRTCNSKPLSKYSFNNWCRYMYTVKNGVLGHYVLLVINKRSKVAFNNWESIVPQGYFGAPHF